MLPSARGAAPKNEPDEVAQPIITPGMTKNQKKKAKERARKARKRAKEGDGDGEDEKENDNEEDAPQPEVKPAPKEILSTKDSNSSRQQSPNPKKKEGEEGSKQTKRGPLLDENVQVKIVDLGNGCWTYHHFTPEIQTRQYRSPEVIIGLDYGTSADVWSFACTIFEMITGDFLFEPRKGHYFDKDDDHLAQMMELLGQMPKNLALAGRHSKRFFDKTGHLRKIRGLHYWPLKKVLMEKYRIKEEEAQLLSDFLLPMLDWNPDRRATAQQMLNHPWLNATANYDYKLSEREYEVMMLKRQVKDQITGGGKKEAEKEEEKGEMSELCESDIEQNNADIESDFDPNHSDLELEDSDSRSLADDDWQYWAKEKKKEVKINNSFTGPYPVDPSDWEHRDKGENP